MGGGKTKIFSMNVDQNTLTLMTTLIFVLGIILSVIGFYTKQFINTVCTTLKEMTTAINRLQAATEERTLRNGDEHKDFNRQLEKQAEAIQLHSAQLIKHDQEIEQLKAVKG